MIILEKDIEEEKVIKKRSGRAGRWIGICKNRTYTLDDEVGITGDKRLENEIDFHIRFYNLDFYIDIQLGGTK